MPKDNVSEFSVSELSTALRRRLEEDFGHVRVRGEISGLKVAASGHLYLALKDQDSVLDGIAWRGTRRRFKFEPEDGLEVICEGKITTFAGRSKYQIIIERMEPAGAGALMAILEKRRAQLEAEGLFSVERKRPLPALPGTIGIVTSPTGAVIRDIIHRIQDRFPVHLLLAPVAVQGESAPAEIVRAIEFFNSLIANSDIPRPDVLIVGRGGGSIEDLWAFNDEHVVRATAASAIPVISAVGHETDTTLIDFAADQRAPTPTAAAEMAVPVRRELMQTLDDIVQRLRQTTFNGIDRHKEQLAGLARGIHDPQWLLSQARQRLDHHQQRLGTEARRNLEAAGAQLERRQVKLQHAKDGPAVFRETLMRMSARLSPLKIQNLLTRGAAKSEQLDHRMVSAMGRRTERLSFALTAKGQVLNAYDPGQTLQRGYVLVTRPDGSIVTNRATAKTENLLQLRFYDQGKYADSGMPVSTVAAPAKPKKKARKPRAPKPVQDSFL